MDKYIKKIFLSTFIGSLYFYLPVFSLFLLDNDITLSVIVVGQISYSVTSFIAEIPTGILADRIGHNKSVALSYFSDALGLGLIAFFPTPITLIIAQAIRGVSGSFLSGSKEALLYEYAKGSSRNYKKDYSHDSSYLTLGFGVSTLLTGIVLQLFNESAYVPIFIITFLLILLAGLIAMTLPDPGGRSHDVGQGQLSELKASLELFRKTTMLKILFLVVGLTYSGQYILLELYQPHMEMNNVSPFFLGASLSIASILNYFIVRNIYKLEDRLSTKLSLCLIALTVGLLYVVFGVLSNPVFVVIAFIFLYGLMGSNNVFISDYANQHSPAHIRATVLSSLSFSKEVFKTVTKIAFAAALGIFSLSSMFSLYGLFLIIGAFISFWLLGIAERRTIAPEGKLAKKPV